MTKKIAIILILVFFNSCYQSMPESWDWGMKARPLTGVKNFPPADTDYGRGFKDGCQSSFVTVGKGAIDLMEPRVNPTLMTKNPDYSNGWFDGMEQCVYILDWDVL